jgi:DNA-binding transcriptional ArsR family regulator
MQLELDFTNKGWRRWAIDRCTRLRSLSVVEGGKPRNLNCSEAKVLLYKIAEYDDCYASVGKLSDDTGIPKRNIERLLKAMEEAGLLKKEPRPVERGQFPTNRYVVFYSELAYVAESSTAGHATFAEQKATKSEPIFLASPSAQPTAQPSAQPTAQWADNKENKRLKKLPSSTKSDLPRTSEGTTCHAIAAKDATIREVEEVFQNLEIGTAPTLVAAAIARGCSTNSLIAIVRWWQRSQRRWPSRWLKPKSVLKIRLETATPNVPAYRGWIPGERPANAAKSSHARPGQARRDPRKALAEAQQNRQEFIKSGESTAEQLKRLRGW